MKKIKLILVISLIVGISFISISVAGGLNIPIIRDFFNEDEKYGEIKNFEAITDINSISFDLDDRHVELIYVESNSLFFSYYEHEDDTWSIRELDGALIVTQNKSFNIFKSFTYKFSSREVRTLKIYIPFDTIDDILVHTEVGDITADFGDMVFDQISISSSTGDVEVSHFTANNVNLESEVGNAVATNFTADDVVLESNTGNVRVEDASFETVNLRNSTGNITANDVVATQLIKAVTSTGNVSVNRSTSPSFDLKTSTGNVNFNNTSYANTIIKYDLVVSVGSIDINGQSQGNRHQTTQGDVTIKAQSSTGKINIKTQ